MRFFVGDGGFLPTKATEEAYCWDIYTPESVLICPGEQKLVKTMLFSDLGRGWGAVIKDRSGLANKRFHTHGGVIDSDYRKEWGVILENTSTLPMTFNPGDRIAQFKREINWDLVKSLPQFCGMLAEEPMVQVDSLGCLEVRGNRVGGFGSTGA